MDDEKDQSAWEDIIDDANTGKEQGTNDCVHITLEDVQPEIDYWQSSIVTYVIGANPPAVVMEGFLRRIWSNLRVDKVIGIQKGLFLVRFTTMENRDKILSRERPFFDSKPMVIKPWTTDMDLTREVIKTIPIWVKVMVNFKYLGIKALEEILKPVGKLIRVDENTARRDKLQYARVTIEVEVNQAFPDSVRFYNEKGGLENATLNYEWLPTICSNCKKMGHNASICYTEKEGRKPGQVWRRKAKETELETTNLYPQEDNAKDKQKERERDVEKEGCNKEQNSTTLVDQPQSTNRVQHGGSEKVNNGMGGTRNQDGGGGNPSFLNG
ncbi:hypothetical protein RDABS01_010501 [Bienertia sinuspersici]